MSHMPVTLLSHLSFLARTNQDYGGFLPRRLYLHGDRSYPMGCQAKQRSVTDMTFMLSVLIFWAGRSEIPHCHDGNYQWEERSGKNCWYQHGQRERCEYLTTPSFAVHSGRTLDKHGFRDALNRRGVISDLTGERRRTRPLR
jgi:hypothetical protein